MGFQIVDFDRLIKKINKAIKLVCAKHGVDDINKLDRKFEVNLTLKMIEVLKLDRKAENDLLDKMIKEVQSRPQKKMPQAEREHYAKLTEQIENLTRAQPAHQHHRSLILNAMTYFIRKEIEKTYSNPKKANKSGVYLNFGIALGLTDPKEGGIIESNQPTHADEKKLFTKLLTFISKNTYVDGDPDNGYLHMDSQPFLAVKGFMPNGFIAYLTGIVNAYNLKSIELCEASNQEQLKLHHEKLKAEKPTTSYFGKFFPQDNYAPSESKAPGPNYC